MGGPLLDPINANTLFLGCNGVDPHRGITNINLPEAEMKRRMLGAARYKVVVADGSKVGQVEIAHLCDIEEIDLLIAGDSADPELIAELREVIEVTIP